MKLYELAKDYLSLMQAIENEEIPEEAIADTLESIEAGIEEKADNIGCLLKNLAAEIAAIKVEENRLAERRKAKENTYERIKTYLSETLQRLDIKKVETARNSITFRKSEAVEVPDEQLFLDWALANKIELLTYPSPKINKTEIKKALKAGEKVECAQLVTNFNIQIK